MKGRAGIVHRARSGPVPGPFPTLGVEKGARPRHSSRRRRSRVGPGLARARADSEKGPTRKGELGEGSP